MRFRELLASRIVWAALLGILPAATAVGAPPKFAEVVPGKALNFPGDFGAHPDFRTEWWYVTGWLQGHEGEPFGFQVTFFRSATETDTANPSRFAPAQLIIAHAALSNPAQQKLLSGEKSAREGFGLAYAKEGNTNVKLDDWTIERHPDGHYVTAVKTDEYELKLILKPRQAPVLQGEQGYSRKGPRPNQASYYYSEPQLQASGTLMRQGKSSDVQGTAWLDHEWSSTALASEATGWDWVGANLNDGGALTVFQIRRPSGPPLWRYAMVRDAAGHIVQYSQDDIQFTPMRTWQSPRTDTTYPVAMHIRTGNDEWSLSPLMNDQELDSRRSSGVVYWEGAVEVSRNGIPAGRGYLELTGYHKRLKLQAD